MAALLCAVLLGGAKKLAPPPTPRAKPHDIRATPSLAPPSIEPLSDLSHALTAPVVAKLPSTADQFRKLKSAIVKDKSAVDMAKSRSERLKAQAQDLRRKLIETAACVQTLERQKLELDDQIQMLAAQDKTLSVGFARDRVAVAQLLAVIERLQHDTPPAMALRPDDALGAARGAMLIGASLPDVYGQAATLARRIETLRQTRGALVARRADAVQTARLLRSARVELDQLLATKQAQAVTAAAAYGTLEAALNSIALQAANLETLMTRVAALRAHPAQQNVVLVTAQNAGSGPTILRNALLSPVVGRFGGARDATSSGPGMTFITSPGAQVVAPADCEVLFAGPYHKSGQILILEVTAGYDLILTGLDRITVRPGDLVLAGEPVGAMPQMGQDGELYFEMRRNGRGANPGPLLAPELRKAKRS